MSSYGALFARHEALEAEFRVGLFEGDTPLRETRLVRALGGCRGSLLGNDLAFLVLLKVGLLKTATGFHLGAAEDGGLGALAVRDGRLLHGLENRFRFQHERLVLHMDVCLVLYDESRLQSREDMEQSDFDTPLNE